MYTYYTITIVIRTKSRARLSKNKNEEKHCSATAADRVRISIRIDDICESKNLAYDFMAPVKSQMLYLLYTISKSTISYSKSRYYYGFGNNIIIRHG